MVYRTFSYTLKGILAQLIFFSLGLSNPLLAADPLRGDSPTFTVRFGESGDEEVISDIAGILRGSPEFRDFVSLLNEEVKFPVGLELQLVSCGQVNAYYQAEKRRVVICYELFAHLLDVFGGMPERADREVADHVMNAAAFVVLHELGHALVDVLGLRFDARGEENAVDELATVLALRMGTAGEKILLSTLENFSASEEEFSDPGMDEDLYEEHAIDADRILRVACIAYGSNPRRFELPLRQIGLSRSDKDLCLDVFDRKSKKWDLLLAGKKQTAAQKKKRTILP